MLALTMVETVAVLTGPDRSVSRNIALVLIGLLLLIEWMLKFLVKSILLPQIMDVVTLGILACLRVLVTRAGSVVIVVRMDLGAIVLMSYVLGPFLVGGLVHGTDLPGGGAGELLEEVRA